MLRTWQGGIVIIFSSDEINFSGKYCPLLRHQSPTMTRVAENRKYITLVLEIQ
jgi:hypothetical protein